MLWFNMETASPHNYFDAANERHLIGNLLEDEDEFSIQLKAPSPKRKQLNGLKISPQTTIIGYNPVKTNANRDLVLRGADIPKTSPRKNDQASLSNLTKQRQSNSEKFIHVKNGQSFKGKTKSPPLSCLSPDDNFNTLVGFKCEGKFNVLRQLTDKPSTQSLISNIDTKIACPDDTSSEISGSSNDSENNPRSRSSRRRNRVNKRNSDGNMFGFVEFLKFALLSSIFPSQTKQSKSKKCRSKGAQSGSNGILISIISFIGAILEYIYVFIAWLISLVCDVVYQLFLAIGIFVRKLGVTRAG